MAKGISREGQTLAQAPQRIQFCSSKDWGGNTTSPALPFVTGTSADSSRRPVMGPPAIRRRGAPFSQKGGGRLPEAFSPPAAFSSSENRVPTGTKG